MGAKAPDALDQNRSHRGKVLTRQAAIWIIKHFTVRDAQYLQGGGKLLPSQSGEFIVVACIAPVRSSASFRKADYAGFHATLMGQHQRSAKRSTLVVGVGGKTHEPQRQLC